MGAMIGDGDSLLFSILTAGLIADLRRRLTMVLFWQRLGLEEKEEDGVVVVVVVVEGGEEGSEKEEDALLTMLLSRQYLSTTMALGVQELVLLLRRLASHLLNSHLTDALAHRLQPFLSPLHFICTGNLR